MVRSSSDSYRWMSKWPSFCDQKKALTWTAPNFSSLEKKANFPNFGGEEFLRNLYFLRLKKDAKKSVTHCLKATAVKAKAGSACKVDERKDAMLAIHPQKQQKGG